MSEEAYYYAHRAQYGCFPDEVPPRSDDDEIFCEECSKCGVACNPDESKLDETTKTWTCCNCLEWE